MVCTSRYLKCLAADDRQGIGDPSEAFTSLTQSTFVEGKNGGMSKGVRDRLFSCLLHSAGFYISGDGGMRFTVGCAR